MYLQYLKLYYSSTIDHQFYTVYVALFSSEAYNYISSFYLFLRLVVVVAGWAVGAFNHYAIFFTLKVPLFPEIQVGSYC
jgi:hypothetical protein